MAICVSNPNIPKLYFGLLANLVLVLFLTRIAVLIRKPSHRPIPYVRTFPTCT